MNRTEHNDFDLVIIAGKTERNYWKDLWKYRELFFFLSWKDILVRYKQTVIGVAWSVLRPFLTMIVFSIIFGKLAKFPSSGVPYPILVYSAMLPWQYFSNAFTMASNSLVVNAGLLSKIYFPRIIIPTSTLIVSMVDFMISFIILCIMMVYYRFMPTIGMLFIPLFLLQIVIATLGFSLFIASLNVKFRDFRYVIPFIVQFGLYISPVGFTSKIVHEKWRLLYSLNPMVGVIDGFRWAILGGENTLYMPGLFLSIVVSLGLFICGISFFRSFEKRFADII